MCWQRTTRSRERFGGRVLKDGHLVRIVDACIRHQYGHGALRTSDGPIKMSHSRSGKLYSSAATQRAVKGNSVRAVFPVPGGGRRSRKHGQNSLLAGLAVPYICVTHDSSQCRFLVLFQAASRLRNFCVWVCWRGPTARFIHFAKTAAKRVIRTHTFPERSSPGVWSPSLRFQNAELGNFKIIAQPDITFGLFRV